MVTGTPSIATVMLGEIEPALARIVSWVEAGRFTFAEADPGPLSTAAYPAEAVRSATARPAPERVIFSASTVVVGDAVAATVAVAAAAGLRGRRAPATISASEVSAGTVGAFPDMAPDSEARTSVAAAVTAAVRD